MLSVRVKALLLLFFISFFSFSAPLNELGIGIQLAKENSYRDTGAPFFDFLYRTTPYLNLKLGTGIFISTKDIEGLIYRIEAETSPLPWLSLIFRSAQRSQFPEGFSHHSLLGAARVYGSPWSGISLFLTLGWYKRWGFLKSASPFSFLTGASFSQDDLATEIGMSASLYPSLEGKLKIATFDPWETYNLNNPFVETSFCFGNPESQDKWLATLRYHLLLGFGRLDRLTFNVFYVTIFN